MFCIQCDWHTVLFASNIISFMEQQSCEKAADVNINQEAVMERAIITVVGEDKVGIIAGVCNVLAAHNVNIRSISQTIVDEYFNMMMIVDISKADMKAGELADVMSALGDEMGLRIRLQKSEIFSQMHRI